MRILYFDLETRVGPLTLSPKNEQLGWELLRAGKGGISSLAIYDTQDRWLHFYDDHTIGQAARHLESADALIGYSSVGFDVPVVEGILGRKLALRHHFDIYAGIALAGAHRGLVGTKGDCTLDTVARRNIGQGKIEHGSHAEDLAKAGHWGKLFNYCADDVRLTRELFHYICEHDGVHVMSTYITLDIPAWLRKAGLEKL